MKSILRTGLLMLITQLCGAQSWSLVGCGLYKSFVICGNYPKVDILNGYNGRIYASGGFSNSCSVSVPGLGQWDGNKWDTVSNGIHSPLLATYNGNLYNADYYNGEQISEWNGSSWSIIANTNNSVSVLLVYDGNLYAAGTFDSLNKLPMNHIAMWNGISWLNVGVGVGSGVDHIASMLEYNGNLIVGGSFTTAGGNPANNIAQWDGANWSALGAGVTGTSLGFSYPVMSMVGYNGNLIVGGAFTNAGGNPDNYIAQWNGINWSNLSSGMTACSTCGGGVYSLAIYNGNLCVGGWFDSAGGISALNIVKWNGSNWSNIGSVGSLPLIVSTLYAYDSVLYAGGQGIMENESVFQWSDFAVITGTDKLSSINSLTIFPNPSNGVFTFQIALNTSGQIVVYNLLGEKVYDATLRQAQGENQIDLSMHPAGMYLYRIMDGLGNSIAKGKLIIN
jgi:trimeric autotransporter adhesin